MTFNVDLPFHLLFQTWNIDSDGKLAIAFFGVFFLAIFYEAAKSFRERLLAKHFKPQCHTCHKPQDDEIKLANEDEEAGASSSTAQVNTLPTVDTNNHIHDRGSNAKGFFSLIHLTQTGLHVLQLIISYFLMLIVMTYNVYLCLAVVMGAGVGYLIFFRRRYLVLNNQECCH